MPVIPKNCRQFMIAGVTCAAAITLSSPAGASVQFDIAVYGGTSGPYNNSFIQPGAVTPNPEVLNYQGSLADPNGEWSILNWDFNGDSNAGGAGATLGVRLASVFTIQNNRPDGATAADNHLYFSIMITQAVDPIAAQTVWGNGGMTLTIDQSSQGFPGQLSAIGSPIWNYLINGSDSASLFPDGYQLGGSNGPATISASGNLVPYSLGVTVTSIGIRLDFDLSPGERVTFNGVFGVIPTPGALALLAVAGLIRRSRRRN